MAVYLPDAAVEERRQALDDLYRIVGSYSLILKVMHADLNWREHRMAPSLERLTALCKSTVKKIRQVRAFPKDSRERRIWRMVDGAVRDAFSQHPDYLTLKGQRSARESVVKRVFGAVANFAVRQGGEP